MTWVYALIQTEKRKISIVRRSFLNRTDHTPKSIHDKPQIPRSSLTRPNVPSFSPLFTPPPSIPLLLELFPRKNDHPVLASNSSNPLSSHRCRKRRRQLLNNPLSSREEKHGVGNLEVWVGLEKLESVGRRGVVGAGGVKGGGVEDPGRMF